MTMQKKHWTPNLNITEEELLKLSSQVKEKIISARIGLLIKHSFFGNLATRLILESADNWCTTAAVDGVRLYYNTQFFNELTIPEIQFVLAHEVLHCVFDHFNRREYRYVQLYNISSDYVINNILVRDKIGKMPTLIECCYDPKYDKLTSEEVYDLLLTDYENQLQEMEEFLSNLGEELDNHIDWEKEDQNHPTLSKEDRQRIDDQVRESVLNAGQIAGELPAEINRLIKNLLNPKIDWKQLLRQQIQSTIKNEYSFVRPSKKSRSTGYILPDCLPEDTIDICIAIDSSGSINDTQVQVFLSEIQGIMDQYTDYQIRIWSFDTKVHNEQLFDRFTTDSMLNYQVTGGGGTDFYINWVYMQQNDISPKLFIMFTDMYAGSSFGDETYCDTIFINYGRPGFEAPFGQTVEYT